MTESQVALNGSHDKISNGKTRASVTARQIATTTAPPLIVVLVTLGLIFGGCCSNVYALETIIKFESSSGTLLTFVQFVFVAATGYVTQFDKSRPPLFLTPNKVPLTRWMVNIILFFTINVLNNHAFSYEISVPVHIILRSGGSIATMTAGFLWGKRYHSRQVLAVVLLTLGVILAAWSDSEAKDSSDTGEKSAFSTGLVVIFVAQVLSAVMGLYTEATYSKYGPQWRENLFYSHVLSLPLFLPFAPSMLRNFKQLAATPPLDWPRPLDQVSWIAQLPRQVVFLATNVLTQYACIRGVNLLAATSSALTVTIVLNIRKLVSLLLSIWLFGNRLTTGTLIGAVIVFSSGALYSLSPRRKEDKQENVKKTQ